MLEVVLDTETTGLSIAENHRIVEIGCVELIDRQLTGNHYHVYINPERLVDEGAFKVHGISDVFLADKPIFKDIQEEFIRFVDGAELIIHNAPFDIGFINSELKLCKWGKTITHHCTVLDTLELARKKHPGQRNSLDALCKRYDIDNSNRELHGALLDAEILGFVYLAMTGGQINMFDTLSDSEERNVCTDTISQLRLSNAIIIPPDEEELAAHQSFVKMLVDKSGVDLFTG